MNPERLSKIKRSCYEILSATPGLEMEDAATIYLSFGINTNAGADEIRDLDSGKNPGCSTLPPTDG